MSFKDKEKKREWHRKYRQTTLYKKRRQIYRKKRRTKDNVYRCKYREKIRLWIAEWRDKNRKCSICDGVFPPNYLELHHPNGDGRGNITYYATSLSRVKKEIEKCCLVCKKCHKAEHSKMRKMAANYVVSSTE